MLNGYLVKYADCIISPNDYFNVLKEHKNEIIETLTKLFESEHKAKNFYKLLGIDTKCINQYPTDWKNEGPWYKTYELKEF